MAAYPPDEKFFRELQERPKEDPTSIALGNREIEVHYLRGSGTIDQVSRTACAVNAEVYGLGHTVRWTEVTCPRCLVHAIPTLLADVLNAKQTLEFASTRLKARVEDLITICQRKAK